MLRLPATAGVVVACALLLPPLSAQRAPQGPPLIREGVTEKISDHVYVIPDGGIHTMVPNVTIVVGTRTTLVIDTGLGARNGQTVLREVAKVSVNSDLALATTHMHPEHALGAHAFPSNTKLYRSRELQAEIDVRGESAARMYSSLSPVMAELIQGAQFRKADVLFDNEHMLDLGGVRVRMMAMGKNHSPGDTAFWIEPDAIVVAGDVASATLPVFSGYSSVSTWLESLGRFERLEPKRIVPGHGPIGDASMLGKSKTFLTIVRARATELKKQGKTRDETVRTIQDELKDRYAPNQMVNAVRTAYDEAP